jgi:hypothetical protein
MKTDLLDRITTTPSDRRKFMMRAGATGLGVAAATMMGGSLSALKAAGVQPLAVQPLNDTQILLRGNYRPNVSGVGNH